MRVERWERRAEVPLVLLAIAFLVAYAWPVLDPRLDPELRTVLEVASWTVWATFAVDLLNAIWWACTTVTTVGYGEHFPVTTEGRFFAVALMVVGIGLVGTVTARSPRGPRAGGRRARPPHCIAQPGPRWIHNETDIGPPPSVGPWRQQPMTRTR